MEDKTFVTHIPELFKKFIDLDLLLDKDQDATFIEPLLDNHNELVKFFIFVFEHLDALLYC